MRPNHLLLTGVFVLIGAAGLPETSHAQTLEADYQLQSTYDSSVGTIQPLSEVGDGYLAFASDDVYGNTQEVLEINTDDPVAPAAVDTSGVQAETAGYGISSSDYSAVLTGSFDLSATGAAATKVFDFNNLSSDAGLYINDSTGLLDFYDGTSTTTPLAAGGTPVVSGNYVQIAITRDGTTGLTTVYEDGAKAFSFTDSGDAAVLGDSSSSGNAYLTVYKDDDTGVAGTGIGGPVNVESSEGNLARLQIYNGALSATQVANVYATTAPEPSTWILLGLGVAGLCLHRQFMCRRST